MAQVYAYLVRHSSMALHDLCGPGPTIILIGTGIPALS